MSTTSEGDLGFATALLATHTLGTELLIYIVFLIGGSSFKALTHVTLVYYARHIIKMTT